MNQVCTYLVCIHKMSFFRLCRNKHSVVFTPVKDIPQGYCHSDELAKDELLKSTWSNTVPYIPNLSYGRIIKCYDGDTCTIVAKLHPEDPIYRFTLRLNGIDAPELRSKSANEKRAAYYVRNRLCEKILGKFVHLKNISTDKYGRVLCDIYYEDENINKWLIDNKYVVEYDGGTKNCPEDWCSYIGISPEKNEKYHPM